MIWEKPFNPFYKTQKKGYNIAGIKGRGKGRPGGRMQTKPQTGAAGSQNTVFVRTFPVLLLGIAGGFFDAYTYVARGGVFCNAQTGNLILLAIGLASGKGLSALRYLVPVAFFILATLVSEGASRLAKRQAERRGDESAAGFRFHFTVLLVEIAVLTAVGFIPTDFPSLLPNAMISSAAALQYHAFRDMNGVPLSTVFCTNNLRLLSGHLYAAFADKDRASLKTAGKYVLFIACFLAGVAIGYFLTAKAGQYAILSVPAIFSLLAAWGLITRRAQKKAGTDSETKEKEIP